MDKYSDININEIVSANLKYGGRAIPLKNLAFAQLCAKVLFIENRELTEKDIASGISKLIRTKKISVELVRTSLHDFSDIFGLDKKSKKWFLKDSEKEEISKRLISNNLEKEKILKKHFTNEININILQKWFCEAVSVFFGVYGDELVKSTCKSIKPNFTRIKTLQEILEDTIKKHKLTSHKDDLIEGFIDFVSSDNADDLSLLASLIQSMFFARLVASEVSADPLTVNELRSSKIIIDTNVFFALALETHRISGSLSSFGDVLSKLDCNSIYLRSTKEEYDRVVDGRKKQILSLLNKFDLDVVLNLNDDFIKTAKARGCATEEDFEIFFENIKKMPDSFSTNQAIMIEEYKELNEVISNAAEDDKLKEKLQKFYKDTKPYWFRPKSKSALNHDVALFYSVDFFRNENTTTYVLTLDKSLQVYSGSILSNNTLPKALSLDALIQLLSIDFYSEDYDAINYAPLLANILLSQFNPPKNIYTMEDLNWLHKINENVAKLPSAKVKEIVNIIAKERMAGRSIKDSQLQLKISRICEKEERTIKQEIEAEKIKRVDVESIYQKEREMRVIREEQLIEEKSKNLKRKNIKEFIYQILYRVFLSFIVWGVLSFLTQDYDDKISTSISFILFVASMFYDNPIKQYKEKIRNVKKQAKEDLGIN